MDEIIRYVLSFVGGGVIAAIINWLRVNNSESKARKAEYLREQINKVYGPANFYLEQNRKLIGLGNKISKAYDVELCQPNWSHDEYTQASVGDEAKRTIDINNSYSKVIFKNNLKLSEIVKENSSYIDIEDSEFFQDFIVNSIRHVTEFEKDKGLVLPSKIYSHLETIYYYKPELNEFISSKLARKIKQLEQLQ